MNLSPTSPVSVFAKRGNLSLHSSISFPPLSVSFISSLREIPNRRHRRRLVSPGNEKSAVRLTGRGVSVEMEKKSIMLSCTRRRKSGIAFSSVHAVRPETHRGEASFANDGRAGGLVAVALPHLDHKFRGCRASLPANKKSRLGLATGHCHNSGGRSSPHLLFFSIHVECIGLQARLHQRPLIGRGSRAKYVSTLQAVPNYLTVEDATTLVTKLSAWARACVLHPTGPTECLPPSPAQRGSPPASFILNERMRPNQWTAHAGRTVAVLFFPPVPNFPSPTVAKRVSM